jgi:hypothetical protein
MRSRSPLLLVVALAALLPWLLAAVGAPHAPAPFHPHFPKTLTCQVTKECTITVGYQTVTFDAKGAAAMEPGQAWHLAGATFETTREVRVGETQIPAGRYALSARKTEGDGWELVLHKGQRFSTPKPGSDEEVLALAGTFTADAPLLEHLSIDIQPAGDKEHTRLFLEVRFDRLLVRTAITVPD